MSRQKGQYGAVPEPAERLQTLLSGDAAALDRIMAVVASVAPNPPTEDEVTGAFNELAIGLGASAEANELTAEDVTRYAYGKLGFVGNTANYYSPANSLIHRVLQTRRGIPLTLAAVASEIGRRVNVELSIVGLPGHVVLGDGPKPSRWFDPFGGGAPLELDDCRRLFARFNAIEAFDSAMLLPIDNAAVARRMLTNLKLVYHRLGNLGPLAAVLDLSVHLPSSTVAERYELVSVLSAMGRFDQAAEQVEILMTLDPDKADDHRRALRRHRASRN